MKGIKQIKKYRLIREIGKGATGVVYEAVDDQTNKLVAVKAIPSAKLQDKRVMENFKRELKLLHGLNHGNIIKITGVEKTVNNIYLILEYCNGGNLYEYSYYFRKTFGKNLPERSVQKILRQLIEGLEYMHNCRTVHRDIKLENILINFNSRSNTVPPGGVPDKVEYEKVDFDDISVKIADLGYARELEGGGVASTICGTPITMAPDIINLFDHSNKDHKYNSKVDLWSLGAITYELLTGRPPFYASNYKQLFEEVMQGKYSLPKNLTISVEAITFINGLLQFYPEKRMSWTEIRSHPFITNETSTFRILDLHTVETNFENPQHLEMNTKDCENFLWILFKPKADPLINLDKMDASIYQNPILNALPKEEEVLENENSNHNENNNHHNQDIIKLDVKGELVKNFKQLKEKDKDNVSSDENYEDANNELNLCGDDDDEKPEQQEIVKETKGTNLTQNQNILNPQEAEKNEKIGSTNNSNTSNRIFDRIFSEMKQELKSSKQSNIEKKEDELTEMRKSRISGVGSNNSKNEKNVIPVSVLKEDDQTKVDHVEEIKSDPLINQNVQEIKEEEKVKAEVYNKNYKCEREEKPEQKLDQDGNIEPKFPLVDDLPKNPSHNIFESINQPPVKESKLCFENISEEKDISINKKETEDIVANNLTDAYPSEDFIQVNRDPTSAEEMWEIISTTSIIEEEIETEVNQDGYQIINEYFK